VLALVSLTVLNLPTPSSLIAPFYWPKKKSVLDLHQHARKYIRYMYSYSTRSSELRFTHGNRWRLTIPVPAILEQINVGVRRFFWRA